MSESSASTAAAAAGADGAPVQPSLQNNKTMIILLVCAGIYYTGSFQMILVSMVGMFIMMVVHLILNQEKMLYVPDPMNGMIRPDQNPIGYRSPADLKLPFKDICPGPDSLASSPNPKPDYELETPDLIHLHAWWIRPEKGSLEESRTLENVSSVNMAGVDRSLIKKRPKGRATVLFCHANAGNMGMRLPNFADLYHRLNMNIFAYDYRGFGNSTGEPSEEGLILDALTCLRYMKANCGVEETYIFGRSLGGAVAIAVAKAVQELPDDTRKEYPRIQGLLLENTFASISLLADKLFSFLQYVRPIKEYFLRIKWDSLTRIKSIDIKKCPILLLVGMQDELVPPSHSEYLRDAAGSDFIKSTDDDDVLNKSSGSTTTNSTVASASDKLAKSEKIKIALFPEGTHNDTYMKGGAAYWSALMQFMVENY